jgi:hypothetical protein
MAYNPYDQVIFEDPAYFNSNPPKVKEQLQKQHETLLRLLREQQANCRWSRPKVINSLGSSTKREQSLRTIGRTKLTTDPVL